MDTKTQNMDTAFIKWCGYSNTAHGYNILRVTHGYRNTAHGYIIQKEMWIK